MMSKVNKQVPNKVGGKNFGMVKRNSMVVVLLLFACVFVLLFWYVSYSLSKIEIPPRVPGIPESAQWHGGSDGGVWIDIDTLNVPNQYYIEFYFEGGRLWDKGFFFLDSLSGKRVFSPQDLHDRISAFTGISVLFTDEMYKEHPNARLRKLKRSQ